MHTTHTPPPHPDRPNAIGRIIGVTCAAAISVMLAGCAPEPVEESLLIEFARDDESGVRMEIRADVALNRDAANADDEAVRKRIDEVAAELAGGTGPWHQRFDRLRNPASDGIDLRNENGELARFQRWAVMTDPGPALVDFFADTQIVPAYEVGPGSRHEAGPTPAPATVTLTFRPAGESPATVDELADARRELLKVGNAVVRFQNTVGEMWTYLEANPGKRRSWIGALALMEEEDLAELEADLSAYEEELLTRLFEDMFSALWPDEATAIDGDPFGLYERLDDVLHAFTASLTVKPDGEVVEAVGFGEREDGYVVSDISGAVADVLEEVVSPNLVRYWVSADLESFFRGSGVIKTKDEEGCDRDCQLNELLSGPFVVRPAKASDIAADLEKALTPLGEHRLRWIRRP